MYGTRSPRLCAETDFDPAPFVARVPDDHTLVVLAALRASAPEGVDRIAELMWERNLGDPRVLALVPSFAPKLESMRAMEWSARMRSADMGRLCPLVDRAENSEVEAPERVRAAALAHASFGDTRARTAITRAVVNLADDEVVAAFQEVWALRRDVGRAVRRGRRHHARPRAADRVGAFPRRRAAARPTPFSCTASRSRPPNRLTTEAVVALLPLPVLEGLAAVAEQRGEQDVAGILEAVAVVSASS